jgi:glycine oxidase
MLAPVSEASFGEENLLSLLLAASNRWPSFAAELAATAQCPVGYRACGTVIVGADRDDRSVVEQLYGLYESLQLDAHRVTRERLHDLVPNLNSMIAAGIHVPDDHQVDNRQFLRALSHALPHLGVVFVNAHAQHVAYDSNDASWSVRMSNGDTVSAGKIVVASGAYTPLIEGFLPGALPPVFPVKGHIIRMNGDPSAPLLEMTVRAVVQGRSCYLVPREDGSIVVGATMEERGYDTSLQAGAVYLLLDDARTLVPGIDELVIAEIQAGLRPGSPDNTPYVGETTTPGLFLAVGHYRNGILLAPLTADAICAHLTDETPPQGFKSWPRKGHA